MYDPPCCAICGGPFDNIELLDFSGLGEDDQYLKETAYDSQLLSPAQSAWSGRFQILAKSNKNGLLTGMNTLSDPDFFVSAEGNWQYDENWFNHALSWTDTSAGGGTGKSYTEIANYSTIHSACMKILDIFLQYQNNSHKIHSPHSPETLQEFINACLDRQNASGELVYEFVLGGEGLPSNWASTSNVEHSHLYFGARRFWTDPWDCEPGFEYLCADPIHEPGAGAFISTCLARPQFNLKEALSSLTSQQVQPLRSASSRGKTLMCLPRELFDLIISRLSLRDALSLCSSSRELLNLLDNNFWRSQTLHTHSCWFWELQSLPRSSSKDNWEALLQTLTASHFEIQKGAEPYWLSENASKNDETKNRSSGGTKAALLSLPLGLRNRQRIWMCIECVGTKAEWEMKEVGHKKSKGRRLGRRS